MDRKEQKQAYCKSWDRKNRCKTRWTERSRNRRTARVGVEGIGVKIDGEKGVEVGVL